MNKRQRKKQARKDPAEQEYLKRRRAFYEAWDAYARRTADFEWKRAFLLPLYEDARTRLAPLAGAIWGLTEKEKAPDGEAGASSRREKLTPYRPL